MSCYYVFIMLLCYYVLTFCIAFSVCWPSELSCLRLWHGSLRLGIGRLLPHCYVSNRPATHLCCVVPSVLHSACVDLAVELPTMSPIDQQHICAVLSLQLNACPLSVASCQESPVQLQIWHRWAACYINSHLYRHFKLGTGEQRVTVHRWAAVAQCTGEQR